MYIKKHVMFAIIILLGMASSHAAPYTDTGRMSKTNAINAFVGALLGGQTSYSLSQVLDDSFQYSTLVLGQQVSFNKKYTLNFFKRTMRNIPDCKINIVIVNENASSSVVKTELHYESFVHTDYLTLTNTGKGWKIIFVYELYENPGNEHTPLLRLQGLLY